MIAAMMPISPPRSALDDVKLSFFHVSYVTFLEAFVARWALVTT